LLNRYRLSYQVHRDGAVTYQCDGIELVRDEGRFVKVLQTEDSSIEIGLRLALAKFGNKLTVHGNDAFKASIARVAADKGLWVEFTDPQINQLMATRKAERQQGRAQTQTSNQPPTARPPSVLNSAVANTELGRYTGQVVGIDQRYVFQAHEQQIIRHDRSLFSTVPAPGENVRISYRGGLLKAEPVKTRSRGR